MTAEEPHCTQKPSASAVDRTIAVIVGRLLNFDMVAEAAQINTPKATTGQCAHSIHLQPSLPVKTSANKMATDVSKKANPRL